MRWRPKACCEPPGRGHGLGVVDDDGEAGDLLRDAGRRVAPGDPVDEPRVERPGEGEAAGPGRVAAGQQPGLDPHERAGRGGLEEHVDVDLVDGAAPGQMRAGLPHGDAAELQGVAAVLVVDLQQPAAHARLDPSGDGPGRVVERDRRAQPPQVHLVGERHEGGGGVDPHLHLRRGRGRCGHGFLSCSTCRLNAPSCSLQWAWTWSSHARTPTRDSGRSRNTRTRASSGTRSSRTRSACQEDPQVAAHDGRGRAHGGRQLAGPVGTLAEQRHHLAPGRVREGVEHLVHSANS